MSTASPTSPSPAQDAPDLRDTHDVPRTLDEGHAPRNLGLLDQLGMWANLGMSLLAFAGALVVLQPMGAPGMGVGAALSALVVGTLVGTAGVSAMALASSQQGQPAMVMLRGLFGGRLSYVPSVLNMVQLVGWGTFEMVTTAFAVKTLWDVPSWPVIGVIGLVTITLAIYPLHWVKVLRKYVTVAVIVVLVYLATQLATRDLPAYHGHGWDGWMIAVDAIIGLCVSWVPVAGDYARHSTSHRAAVIGSYVGYSVTQIAVYCIGMVALVIAGGDGDKVFSIFLGITGGTLCFWVLTLREIDACFVDVYSPTVSAQNMLPRVDRRLISTALGIISMVLAWSIDIYGFATFLSLIGSVFAPLLGVFLVDYYAFGGRRRWNTSADAPGRPLMLLPWLAGFAMYQLISPGELGWWSRMWHDVAGTLHFTAPSWMSASLTSFLTAVVLTAVVDGVTRRGAEANTKVQGGSR